MCPLNTAEDLTLAVLKLYQRSYSTFPSAYIVVYKFPHPALLRACDLIVTDYC